MDGAVSIPMWLSVSLVTAEDLDQVVCKGPFQLKELYGSVPCRYDGLTHEELFSAN